MTEAGLSGASHPVIRSFAIEADRLLITLDADFGNIPRYPVCATPGVIWLRLHPPAEDAIFGSTDRVLRRLPDHNLSGKLVIVDEHKIRVPDKR